MKLFKGALDACDARWTHRAALKEGAHAARITRGGDGDAALFVGVKRK